MRRFVCICLTLLASVALSTAGNTTIILCYLQSTARNLPANGRFTVAQIPANQCTHIVYTFILPLPGGQLAPFTDDATLRQLVALRERQPALKILAGVGGWLAGSAVFSAIASDPVQRERLAGSLASFCASHQLDGIDVIWQYPTQRVGSSPADRDNFTALLRDIRRQLTWSRHLTAAVGANPALIGSAYDVPAISAQLSYINLVTYERNAAFAGRTVQNAPLYASPANPDQIVNGAAVLAGWLRAGAPPAKILFGLAFFGHYYRLVDGRQQHGLGAPTVGDGPAGPYSRIAGILSYLEICGHLREGGWSTVYDDAQQSVYSYCGDDWIGYDDAQSIGAKVRYAVGQRLAGVLTWTLDYDDANGACGGGALPLLKAVNAAIGRG